jgi:CheY-like chemotaxis protein
MNKELPYILLADDDPDDLVIFSEAIGELNPDVAIQTVIDGKELIEFLDACDRDELPTLIVLDYKMPVISGPEVLQRLAANPAYVHIPRIVWSTSERLKDIETCLQLGATAYFKKPASSIEIAHFRQQINDIFLSQIQHSRS